MHVLSQAYRINSPILFRIQWKSNVYVQFYFYLGENVGKTLELLQRDFEYNTELWKHVLSDINVSWKEYYPLKGNEWPDG